MENRSFTNHLETNFPALNLHLLGVFHCHVQNPSVTSGLSKQKSFKEELPSHARIRTIAPWACLDLPGGAEVCQIR